jgi:hypothetical protein
VTSTAHWTAIIATGCVALCLVITIGALASVVIRDGNSTLVAQALAAFVGLGQGFAIVLGALVAGPQIVSALVGRFWNTGGVAPQPPMEPTTPTP